MPGLPPEVHETVSAILERGVTELGLKCPQSSREQLITQLELLLKWNRSFNLTAITEPEQIVTHHILDSLSVVPWIRGGQVIDVGTGAGYPGLPLAMTLPDIHVTLLDSRGKKIRFVDTVIRTTRLTNAVTVHGRVEDFRPEVKFDTLVARAFASLADIIQLGAHLVKPGGRIVALKGEYPIAELNTARASFEYGFDCQSVQVPGINAERHIVTVSV